MNQKCLNCFLISAQFSSSVSFDLLNPFRLGGGGLFEALSGKIVITPTPKEL